MRMSGSVLISGCDSNLRLLRTSHLLENSRGVCRGEGYKDVCSVLISG